MGLTETLVVETWPVPVREMVWGELVALSAMEMLAVRVPAAVGEKATLMLQVALAARVGPQVVAERMKSDEFVPEKEILIPDKAAVPVLDRVMVCAALVEPTASEANVMDEGETMATGAERPVPERGTARNVPKGLALLLPMVNDPVTAPVVTGTNARPISQELPCANEVDSVQSVAPEGFCWNPAVAVRALRFKIGIACV